MSIATGMVLLKKLILFESQTSI